MHSLYNHKQFNKVLIFKDNKKEVSSHLSYLSNYISDKNKPVVYVCKNYVCNLPTSDIDKVSELLNK